MIDRATVDRILDAAQIVDVVSDFVTLRKAGVNYKGLCPFHDDRTPSFVVSPSKGLCKCFSCGKGGNSVRFIMEHEQLTYPEALRYLAGKYNIEIQEKELTGEELAARNERESMFIVNEWARNFFQNQMYDTVDGRAIGMAYFRSRGFRDDIIRKFQLGFCPIQKDACAREAKSKGYQEDFLLKTGLCYKRDNGQLQDRFWGRVIFPVHTLSGKIVAFGGRVLETATKGVSMKYQNSPESTIYSKKKELYGLFLAKQAIVKNDLCYLVEGYTDVISMHQSGIENVVSSSGTALTNEQIRMIHRFTDNITVLYDGDAAGIKASERGIDMLLAEGMNVKLLLLPDGDDPDSFARKHTSTEYQNYLNENQIDFIKFKTNLLLNEAQGDPIKLSRLVNNIVQSIAVIPDDITRSLYIRETAMMLSMEERLLVAAINKQITANKTERKKQQNNQATTNTPPAPEHVLPENYPPTEVPPAEMNFAFPPPPFPSEEIPEQVIPEIAPPQTVSYIPHQGAEKLVFYHKELLLIQTLVRYGDKTMCYIEEENGTERPLSVTEYIDYALQEDKLEFHNPLHKQMLKEALEHLSEPGFKAERYFLNHLDATVNNLAFELLSDKYQLSKYHSKGQKIISDEERLMELVPHLMTDFKLAIVNEELKHILLKLRNPDILKNKAQYMEVMTHYKEVKEIENSLARQRGDRVITR